MDLSIRSVTMEDLPAVSALYEAIGRSEPDTARFPSPEEMLRAGGVFAAEVDGRCTAAVWLSFQPLAAKGVWQVDTGPNQALTVQALAVHPAHRRQGIARALLANTDLIAAQWRCLALRLRVSESNAAAVALLTSFGYQKRATIRQSGDWLCLFERQTMTAARQLFSIQ